VKHPFFAEVAFLNSIGRRKLFFAKGAFTYFHRGFILHLTGTATTAKVYRRNHFATSAPTNGSVAALISSPVGIRNPVEIIVIRILFVAINAGLRHGERVELIRSLPQLFYLPNIYFNFFYDKK